MVVRIVWQRALGVSPPAATSEEIRYINKVLLSQIEASTLPTVCVWHPKANAAHGRRMEDGSPPFLSLLPNDYALP